MPNEVIGTSDVVGGAISADASMKTVYVICAKGTGGTMADLDVEQVISKSDASAKIGSDANAVDIVQELIDNGAKSIYLVAHDSAGADDAAKYEGGLNAIQTVSQQQMLIILDIDYEATVAAKVKTHLSSAETDNKFRYAVLGSPNTNDIEALKTLASGIDDERILMPGPVTIEADKSSTKGYIQAARFAGLISAETADPALPLNSVEVVGPVGTKETVTSTVANALAASQVATMIADGSSVEVWRTATTSTDASYADFSAILILDYVLNGVMTRLKNTYKRNKKVDRVLKSIRDDVIDELLTYEAREIIQNFNADSVIVQTDPTNSFGATVDYDIEIVLPLYTIKVSQHGKV